MPSPGVRSWMELVTMPLSQRTRSSPVTRIQPVLSRGAIAADVSRSAAELRIGGAGCAGGQDSVWVAEVIGEAARKLCVHCDYSGRLGGHVAAVLTG